MPQILAIMGMACAGQATIGRLLAAELGWVFPEGDGYHPDENRRKMHAGTPLNDQDRGPWLAAMATEIDRCLATRRSAVLAASMLKECYRAVFRKPGIRFVYLRASPETLRERLAQRPDHFFPLVLLETQLADLEEPADALWVEAIKAPSEIVDDIILTLG